MKINDKSKLRNFIDIQLLQEFQDFFARTMGVASITVDDEGPITQPSSFTDFCIKYTRGTELGYQRCNQCGIQWGKIASKKGEPVIYKCHTGLVDFAVPIMLNGEHIASILGGQVLTEPPNEEHFKEIAKELGINEDEYIDAVKKIKIVPAEQIKMAADFMFFMANAISAVSYKNMELDKKNKQETLLRNIIEKIRAFTDIDETLDYICEETAKLFNVQRTAISVFPNAKNPEEFHVKTEYKISEDIKEIKQVENFKLAVDFWGATLLKNDEVVAFDNVENSNTPDYFKNTYSSMGVKAMLGTAIRKGNDTWGSLVLAEYNNTRQWTKEEKALINTIADQIYIAINQAELFDNLKKTTANQNAILNNIPFMAWLKDRDSKLLAVNEAFAKMFNTTKENIVGKTDFDLFPKEEAEGYRRQDRLVIETKQPQFIEEMVSTGDGLRMHENFKSPVFDDNGNVIGTVGLSRDITERKETEKEIQLKQEQIIKAAKRETLLRKIIETVRSSFDINEVKKSLIKQLCEAFNADRCYFRDYDVEKDRFLPVKEEYLASAEATSLANIEPDQEQLKYFAEELKKQKKGFYPIMVDKNFAKNTPVENYLNQHGTKVHYAIPVTDTEKEEEWFVLNYLKENMQLDEESETLLETIAYQIDIGFRQIQLYNNVKQVAERESVLREIMLSSISTFDIEKVQNTIVTATGKLFNADRCFIVERDPETGFNRQINDYAQYLSSSDIRTHTDILPGEAETEVFREKTNRKEATIVEDITKVDLPDATKKMLIDKLSVKSYLIIPLFYGEEMYGSLVFHYVKDFRLLTKEEINFAQAIAYQSTIVINQAKIYKKTQVQAEREKVSKNIVEILRSTLDKNIIKHLFVVNIGKLLKADRVFFSDYDAKAGMYLPVDKDSEYLSIPTVKSFVNYDWANEKNREYIQPLLEKRELLMYSYEKYINENQKSEEFRRLFEEAGVKSSYNLPVLYQGQIMGYFCIEFTHEENKLSNEDINRIRNMCTQAGIALYHADLLIKAKEATHSKEEFIENISNEFRAPLNIILDLSEKLSRFEYKNEVQSKFINEIIKNCKQLLDITDNVIEISEIESENFMLHYEHIDSEQLITDAVDSIKIIANNKKINFETKTAKANIYADKKIIRKILDILLNNAIKSCQDFGVIETISELRDEKLFISIESSGSSYLDNIETNLDIMPEQQRYEATRPGSSLELSIAKKLIELHKGNIHIESKYEKGTRIWFVIPKAYKVD